MPRIRTGAAERRHAVPALPGVDAMRPLAVRSARMHRFYPGTPPDDDDVVLAAALAHLLSTLRLPAEAVGILERQSFIATSWAALSTRHDDR